MDSKDIEQTNRYNKVLQYDEGRKKYLSNLVCKNMGMIGGLPALRGTRLCYVHILRDYFLSDFDYRELYPEMYEDFVDAAILYMSKYKESYDTYINGDDAYHDVEPYE